MGKCLMAKILLMGNFADGGVLANGQFHGCGQRISL
jgi:hypothetical protein